MREGFQRPNPDGSPGLKVEKAVSLESVSVPDLDDSSPVTKSPGQMTERELHEHYRTHDTQNSHEVGVWHEPSDQLVRDMAALRDEVVKDNQKKARLERGKSLSNKAFAEQEDQYVVSPARLSQEESEKEFDSTGKRTYAAKKPKPQKPNAQGPSPEPKTAPNTLSSRLDIIPERIIEPRAEAPRRIRLPKGDVVKDKLDFIATNAKLRRSSERLGNLKDNLQESEAAFESASAKRIDHKVWLDEISGGKSASRIETRGNLRKEHAIPEKAIRKADKEAAALSNAASSLRAKVERNKRSLKEEAGAQSKLRERVEDLIQKERERSFKFTQPYEARIKEAREVEKGIKESLSRFEGVAAAIEKRLNEHKARLQDAQFNSQRTALNEWIHKDELLLKSLNSRGPLSRGFGVKSGVPASIDGLRKKLAANEKKMRACEAKIAERRNKVSDLEGKMKKSLETGVRKEAVANKPREEKREKPAKKNVEAEAIATVHHKDNSFEILHPKNASGESDVPARERVAKSYANDWNKRYGSIITIKPEELEPLLPDDREPDEHEMDSILETYITARSSRIWELPGLSSIFSNITRNRIRAMHASRRR